MIEYSLQNKDSIINSIHEELNDPDSYVPRPAYAIYPPKTDLCYRRMIYIPFKDLVIRYAFVSVLADYLDNGLSERCFANRRAKGNQSSKMLLEDFASVSWPGFCTWQKDCANEYSVLLKTDISSFYDSISHNYLIKQIATELGVQDDTKLMYLFNKILCIPVISYSNFSNQPQPPLEMKQGLSIGNNTDGFLANLFIKDIDETMNKVKGIVFGRYNDDMRIFGNDRRSVLDAVLILQELLLAKGLNLNSGKSEMAENETAIEELRSKYYEVYDYHNLEEIEKIELVENEVNHIINEIDQPFDEFNRTFTINEDISTNKDAKEFCKFMSDQDLLPIEERFPEHIKKLDLILKKWQGSGKHASWLIIQSSFFNGVPGNTKTLAKEIMFKCLNSDDVDSYSKYRLIHHLVKIRGSNKKFRFIERLSDNEKKELVQTIPLLLRKSAFELNIIGLYTLKVLECSTNEIQKYISDYIPKPIGEPIKKIILYLQDPIEVPEELLIDTDYEPDDHPFQY